MIQMKTLVLFGYLVFRMVPITTSTFMRDFFLKEINCVFLVLLFANTSSVSYMLEVWPHTQVVIGQLLYSLIVSFGHLCVRRSRTLFNDVLFDKLPKELNRTQGSILLCRFPMTFGRTLASILFLAFPALRGMWIQSWWLSIIFQRWHTL